MIIIKQAIGLSAVNVLFFIVCAIIGFASAEKFPNEEFQIYSNFFGINGVCFALFWIQVLYRFARLNVDKVSRSNQECFSGLEQLIEATLNNSDYYFQKCLCCVLAITHSYSTISLTFTQQYIYYLFWDYYQFFPWIGEDEAEDQFKDEAYGGANQYNAIIFMQVMSLTFGAYLQLSIVKKTFFRIVDEKKEEILYLNKDLPQGDEEEYQSNVVKYSIAHIFLLIAILAIRLGVYIYISQNEEADELSQLAIYVFCQTIYFILYCFLILYTLFVIRNQMKNKQTNVLNQNKELFQGWYTLVNSIMYSEIVKIFGAVALILIFVQSIFGFRTIQTRYTIYRFNQSSQLKKNLLLIDTITVSIFLSLNILKQLLYFLFPNSNQKILSYQFTTKKIAQPPITANNNNQIIEVKKAQQFDQIAD